MYYYILNPAAGRGQINNLQEKLRSRLQELGISGEFAKTTGEGDATKMTKAAIEKGYTTIVAVGGDGTVNEVMNGIRNDAAALGIIPIGRSNALANHFGIHNWQQACEVLAARRITSYALIAAGQKFFLSDMNLGFETDPDDATLEPPEPTKLGRFKEAWQSLKPNQRTTALAANIQVDERFEVDAEIMRLNLTNQKFNNPLADNKLVISLYDHPAKHNIAKVLWEKASGREPAEEHPSSRFYARRLVISTEPATSIMIDGKVAGRTPIAIRLTDRRIRFITEKQISNIKATL
jgi:diacylglycerol kinase family enzyme